MLPARIFFSPFPDPKFISILSLFLKKKEKKEKRNLLTWLVNAKKKLFDMLLTFFSDPVLILKVYEIFRTKTPRETSTRKRFSAKVRENPKFSLPQAKEVQV